MQENSASPSVSASPESSSASETKHCLVCGHVCHGYHFGILACRACAAFFRRTVAEKKSYKCRSNCNCTIKKEMRNMCRCCRFKKCEELGMNRDDVQLNRDSIGKRTTTLECCPEQTCFTIHKPSPVPIEDTLPPVNSPRIASPAKSAPPTLPASILYPFVSSMSNSGFNPCQQITLLPYTSPEGPSVLQRMQEGFSNFQSSQKSLFTVMNPDNIFVTEVYKKVTHTEFVKMERGCLSLLFSMLNDFFHPFDKLPQQMKINVLQNFSLKFSLLNGAYNTARMYPDNNVKKWIMHYGQFLDFEDLEYFFQEDTDPKESAKLCLYALHSMTTCKKQVVKLKIDETELAALIGIMLWNEVSYLLADENDATEKIRDRIYAELHNYLILRYGVGGTGARLGALLLVLQGIQIMSKEINENIIIGKLFNPHMIEIWEDL